MIDSVLKGTGNSRFLKSAVPAGTSWAEALAMLQAGTFPIDFNGINTEGFQRVGTPLNKANLLKDATATKIGLSPSATPDDMFGALGDTGELHVWKKTVTTTEEIPAGYTLGDVISTWLVHSGDRTYGWNCTIATGVTVDDAGNLTFTGQTTHNQNAAMSSSNYTTLTNEARGKFVHFNNTTYVTADTTWYYVPEDATFYFEEATSGYVSGERYSIKCDKLQTVTGYPLTPVGTTTTYPVSTNPNAWQEADDAKAAGYVLEASKQMIAVKTTNSSYKYYAYNYAESISVSDDGTVSLIGALKASGRPFQTDSFNAAKGKFCQFIIEDWFDGYVSTEITGIVFIPSDAVFSVTTLQATCSKVQPVTGYPAIPAGTTIEYLGKLGDKAKVQVVSYVGTGTYGESNPISLTFDFAPKYVRQIGHKSASAVISEGMQNFNYGIPIGLLSESFTSYTGFGGSFYTYGKKSHDGKTITWYNTESASSAMNYSGTIYYVIAFA